MGFIGLLCAYIRYIIGSLYIAMRSIGICLRIHAYTMEYQGIVMGSIDMPLYASINYIPRHRHGFLAVLGQSFDRFGQILELHGVNKLYLCMCGERMLCIEFVSNS